MKKLARLGAIGTTVAVVSLIGFSSVASAASIYGTGPFSRNTIFLRHYFNYQRFNNNNVFVNNNNFQSAYSGRAVVFGNTFGGDAISGDASNWNDTSTNVSINN